MRIGSHIENEYSAELMAGMTGNKKAETADNKITHIQRLADYFERLNIERYTQLLQKPWRMIGLNLVSGMARGAGIAIGFTILGAVILYLLGRLAILNLPLVGDFIAEIWSYVNQVKDMRIY
jgi:hypothetical protein